MPGGDKTADARGKTIGPGGLDEGAPGIGVAGAGDGALVAVFAGGVFARHEPQVGHQPARCAKARQIAQFRDQRDRVQERDAAHRLKRGHYRSEAPGGRLVADGLDEPLDPAGEYVYQTERGPVRCEMARRSYNDDGLQVAGKTLIDMSNNDYADPQTQTQAKQLMRKMINHLLGDKILHTRQLMRDLR